MPTTYSTIYSFGDSLSDAGDAYLLTTSNGFTPEPVSPPYYQETYGTVTANVFSNGPIWVQDLASMLGVSFTGPGKVFGSAGAAGGTDFAIGGSVTGPTGANTGFSVGITDLSAQISNFKSEYATPAANALYTVWSGSNDVLNLVESSNFQTQSAATSDDDMAQSAGNELTAIEQLAAGGAKTILVANVPDLGLTPTLANTALAASGTKYAQIFNTDLAMDLQNAAGTFTTDGTKIVTMDVFSLIDNSVNSVNQNHSLTITGQNGGTITNATSPAYNGPYTSNDGSEVANPNNYLFFDHLHPTQTGHQAIANLAYDDLMTACYCPGTRIATPGGEAEIETLRMGDKVLTASGKSRTIKWIGRREVSRRHMRRDPALQPIRFAAGSLGGALPRRDLVVSADHAMAAHGLLIPAAALVNGVTITRERVEETQYWHIELETHDLLLAEGAASESFVDDEGSRNGFSNVAEYHGLYGEEAPRPAKFCLPRLTEGPTVEAIRRRFAPGAAA